MTAQNEGKIWSAYLDGELSASEASQFDSALSEADRARLTEELRFERQIAEHLASAPPCPARLWEKTAAHASRREERRGWRMFGGWRALSMAAAFAVAVSVFLAMPRHDDPQFLAQAASLDSLRQQAQVFSPDAVQALLVQNGVGLRLYSLEDIGMGDHEGFLVGAAMTTYAGEPIVQILYVCCGNPVKIVVARAGGAAAGRAAEALANGTVRACCAVDGYVVAIVGDHACTGLLRLLQ